MSEWRSNEALPGYVPVSEGFESQLKEIKPTWRGWIHAGVLPIVIAAGIVLIVLADGVAAKVTGAVFYASSILLFGNSALYHRFNWKPKTKLALKRIDHANIFLLIAGSYTPITWLALERDKAVLLLAIIWGTAVLGIGFRIFWISAPRWLYVPIYVGMGWGAMAFIADFMNANAAMMILILVGGLCYTVGAVVYGLKKPNPFPGKFGFHEIFHTFTVLAFMCHWTGILLISLSPITG
jgi:hemolysin III